MNCQLTSSSRDTEHILSSHSYEFEFRLGFRIHMTESETHTRPTDLQIHENCRSLIRLYKS